MKRAILDKNVKVPEHATIGYDLEADSKKYHVTESGIVIVEGYQSKDRYRFTAGLGNKVQTCETAGRGMVSPSGHFFGDCLKLVLFREKLAAHTADSNHGEPNQAEGGRLRGSGISGNTGQAQRRAAPSCLRRNQVYRIRRTEPLARWSR